MGKHADEYATPQTSDQLVSRWLLDVTAQVAPRPHLNLSPARCALLVIDPLRFFVDPSGGSFLPASTAACKNIERLVEAWRGLGATIVYTRHCHRGPSDTGMMGRFYRGYIDCAAPDSALSDCVKPAPGELVIRKNTYDSFLGTNLQQHLERMGIEQVLITGVMTHLCCETTARSAFCRGFEVYVSADATASSTERLHTSALLTLADGVAVVMSTQQVLERCETSTHSS